MKIDIQSPGLRPKSKLLAHIHQQVNKVAGLFDEIINVEVCLSLDNSSTNENKNCRIRLAIPGNDLISFAGCRTFEEAAKQSADSLRRQIEKIKTKKRRQRTGSYSITQEML